MATDIDLPHLGTYLDIAEPSLTTVLSAPTQDLVASVLRAVAKKAKEHEQARSNEQRLELELENAMRLADGKARATKTAMDKSSKQLTELREKLTAEGR
jgi:hypothetical protein